VAEKLLGGFEVSGHVEDPLAGGVTGLVHPLAAAGTGGDDPGALEASVPPRMQAVTAHRLIREQVVTERRISAWPFGIALRLGSRKWCGCTSVSMIRPRSSQNPGSLDFDSHRLRFYHRTQINFVRGG
jgi:hypothetical protein